jgi:hypothetical protein
VADGPQIRTGASLYIRTSEGNFYLERSDNYPSSVVYGFPTGTDKNKKSTNLVTLTIAKALADTTCEAIQDSGGSSITSGDLIILRATEGNGCVSIDENKRAFVDRNKTSPPARFVIQIRSKGNVLREGSSFQLQEKSTGNYVRLSKPGSAGSLIADADAAKTATFVASTHHP